MLTPHERFQVFLCLIAAVATVAVLAHFANIGDLLWTR